MIIDVCGLRDELDVFELRLRELGSVVDRFIVVQSEETHSGLPKLIAFNPDDARWQPWRGRLSTAILPRMETPDRWVREHAMREVIASLLVKYEKDDIVVMSDVDEVPSARDLLLAWPLINGDTWIGFDTKPYFYYLNLRVPVMWRAIALARVDTVRRVGAQMMRDQRRQPPVLVPGGWHFSYLGGVEAIRRKLAAFAHAEYDNAAFADSERLARCIAEQRDLFDTKGPRGQLYIEPMTAMPRDVQQHPERYASMLLQEVEA